MTRRRRLLPLAVLASLAACSISERAERRGETLADEAARHRGTLAAQQRGGVVEVNAPFYGQRSPGAAAAPAAMDRGKPLPAELEEDLGVEILATAAPLATIQEIIAGATDLDVVVRTRYPTAAGVIEMPVAGVMSIEHRGPLSQLLDRVASRFDLGWSFDGSAIRFDRMVSVIHDVPLPATAGTLSAEISGVQTASATVRTGKEVEVDPWAEISAALEQVVAPPASVSTARTAGKITVFGPPSVHRAAAAVIDRFADLYAKRIGLEIATYFVDAGESQDNAVGTFLQAATGDADATLGRGLLTSGTVGDIAIVGGKFDGSEINFRALATDKNVVDYRVSNTVGQNGVVAPVTLLTTQNYVRETTTETDDAGKTTLSVKVDSIDTGLSIFALPRIVAGGRIQLSLWIREASLNRLDRFGDVQLPKTDHRAVEYTVILAPGETLIMGGYEQETVRRERDGTGAPWFLALGGSDEAEIVRTAMVVLVRPTIIGG